VAPTGTATGGASSSRLLLLVCVAVFPLTLAKIVATSRRDSSSAAEMSEALLALCLVVGPVCTGSGFVRLGRLRKGRVPLVSIVLDGSRRWRAFDVGITGNNTIETCEDVGFHVA